ncbi:MAG: hypothetical protein ACP5N0_09460 [Methanosarcina sp.]|uniref:hypothetical protein n=1 Tax=Methanosarcina sp. TaxID=2213 RepID=UPI003BB7C4ED
MPRFFAIFAIALEGSSPNPIPREEANLPVPTPISSAFSFSRSSGRNALRAKSSDSYAGLYFSYQASYSSAYLSKVSHDLMKIPPLPHQ